MSAQTDRILAKVQSLRRREYGWGDDFVAGEIFDAVEAIVVEAASSNLDPPPTVEHTGRVFVGMVTLDDAGQDVRLGILVGPDDVVYAQRLTGRVRG